ncbi:MAG TPA: PIN domain-containing protein [Thermoanaerobaculia bacterium]|nr:PIN domain-containing protein [Thermoanaerobaculia bacterium]
MRIYLDMCSIQRPLDTRSHVRIAVEAEAVLGIFALLEAGELELVASDALMFEAERNPHPVRKRYALDVISRATLFVHTDERIEERARFLVSRKIKPLDALHLATAERAKADCFCTCDDRFLKRARAVGAPPPRIVSPLELIAEIAS